MTNEQKMDRCIQQLLYNEKFLSRYEKELKELYNSPSFMRVIGDISNSVSEELEFSANTFAADFEKFKKKTIGDTFFAKNLIFNFSAYNDIVSSVTADKMTKLSAAISVYYSLRYMELSSTDSRACEKQDDLPIQDFVSDYDFRQTWKPEYRCDDGHYVRSKNEQLVDNWLYNHNICHAYEPLVVDKRDRREYISDFYIPQFKLYVEVWGMETQKYLRRKSHKLEVYQANNLKLLQLSDKEIKSLDDCMMRSLGIYRP